MLCFDVCVSFSWRVLVVWSSLSAFVLVSDICDSSSCSSASFVLFSRVLPFRVLIVVLCCSC